MMVDLFNTLRFNPDGSSRGPILLGYTVFILLGAWTGCTGDMPETSPPAKVVVDPVDTPTLLPTQTLRGTKDKNTSVLMNGQVVVPMNSSIAWETAVQLNEGLNILYFSSKDPFETESTRIAVGIEADFTAPAPPTVDPADSFTTSSEFTMSGEKPLDASLFLDGEMIIAQLPESDSFSIEVLLDAGTNSFSLTTKDTVGNESAAAVFEIERGDFSFTVDPVTGTTNIPEFTVTGTRSEQVTITRNNIEVIGPNQTADTWSYDTVLQEGNNTLVLVGTRESLSSTKSVAVTLDTIAPPVPTLISPPEEVDTPLIYLSGLKSSDSELLLDRGAGLETFVSFEEGSGQTTFINVPVTLELDVPTTLMLYARDRVGNMSTAAMPAPTVTYAPGPVVIAIDSVPELTDDSLIIISGDRPVDVDIFLPEVSPSQPAAPMDGTTRWTLEVELQPGENTILVEGRRGESIAQESATVVYSADGPEPPVLMAPTLTTQSTLYIQGTKPANTAILLNGDIVQTLSASETFGELIDLNDGLNVYSWQTRDVFDRDSNAILTSISKEAITASILTPTADSVLSGSFVVSGTATGPEFPLKARIGQGAWVDVVGFSDFSASLDVSGVGNINTGEQTTVDIASDENGAVTILTSQSVVVFFEPITLAPVSGFPMGSGAVRTPRLMESDENNLAVTFSWYTFNTDSHDIYYSSMPKNQIGTQLIHISENRPQQTSDNAYSPRHIIDSSGTQTFFWLEEAPPFGVAAGAPGILSVQCDLCDGSDYGLPYVLQAAGLGAEDETTYFSDLQMVNNSSNLTAAVWVRHVPNSEPSLEMLFIENGVQSGILYLTTSINFTSVQASSPRIVMDEENLIHLVWSDQGGLSSEGDMASTETDIYYRRICVEANFIDCEQNSIGNIRLISDDTAQFTDGESTQPELILDPSDENNRVFIAWLENGNISGDSNPINKVAMREIQSDPQSIALILSTQVIDASAASGRQGASDLNLAMTQSGRLGVAFVESGAIFDTDSIDSDLYLRFYEGGLRELIPINDRDDDTTGNTISATPAMVIDSNDRVHIIWAESENFLVAPEDEADVELDLLYFTFEGLSP
jgi:hypothetical protein